MKNIYHIHQSSNSYRDSHWTDIDYYLCDSEEEYKQLMAKYAEKRKNIEEEYKRNQNFSTEWMFNYFLFSKEEKVHAKEYYYAHEWCGKSFDAIGFYWYERLERSSHYKYFLRPGSISNESRSSAVGRFTGYGS